MFSILILGGLTAALTAMAGYLLGQPTMADAGAPCFELQTGSAEGIIVAIHIRNPGVSQVQLTVEDFGATGEPLPKSVPDRVIAPRSTLVLAVTSPYAGSARIIGSEPIVVTAEFVSKGRATPLSTILCRADS